MLNEQNNHPLTIVVLANCMLEVFTFTKKQHVCLKTFFIVVLHENKYGNVVCILFFFSLIYEI